MTPDHQETVLGAEATAGQASVDRRHMLPIEEAAAILDVSVATLKRHHLANPADYPAERIGTLWRIPCAWVEAKTAWPREVPS